MHHRLLLVAIKIYLWFSNLFKTKEKINLENNFWKRNFIYHLNEKVYISSNIIWYNVISDRVKLSKVIKTIKILAYELNDSTEFRSLFLHTLTHIQPLVSHVVCWILPGFKPECRAVPGVAHKKWMSIVVYVLHNLSQFYFSSYLIHHHPPSPLPSSLPPLLLFLFYLLLILL